MALSASNIDHTQLGFQSSAQLTDAINAIPHEIWQQLTENHLPYPANPTDNGQPYILAVDTRILFSIDVERNTIALTDNARLIQTLTTTTTPPKLALLCHKGDSVKDLLRAGVAALTHLGLPLSMFYCVADRNSPFFQTRQEILGDKHVDPLGPPLYHRFRRSTI